MRQARKILIEEIMDGKRAKAKLFRDPKTGIAWVEDYNVGVGHSAHPNINARGSVAGMKKKGYWGKRDRTVRSHGWVYNIDLCVVTSEYDEMARDACRCDGNHECTRRS